MSKSFFLFLVYTINTYTLVICDEFQDKSFTLHYALIEFEEEQNRYVHGKGTEMEINIFDKTFKKEVLVFKVPSLFYFDWAGRQEAPFMNLRLNNNDILRYTYIPRHKNNEFYLEALYEFFNCNLDDCRIGIMLYKNNSEEEDVLKDLKNVDKIFYVSLEGSNGENIYILKLLPKYINKYVFDVVLCPKEGWISKNSLVQYIADTSNIMNFPNNKESKYKYFYKISYYQNNGANNLLKCGQLKQLLMPSLDVVYNCYTDGKKRKELYLSEEDTIYTDLNINSNYRLSYEEGDNLLNSTIIAHLVLSPEKNYKSNSTIVSIYNSKSKLYSGQRLNFRYLSEYDEYENKIGRYTMGYDIFNEPTFLVPDIRATLRLKINGVVQNFKNDENYCCVDTYVIDKSKISDGLVGCHAVPDDMKHPTFDDFYEKRYQTNLLMFDEKTDKYLEVYDIKSLVSNSKYKCVININTTTSDNKKPKFIKETNFTISFSNESSFTTWIIIGVSVSIISLLVIGLIIYKKLKPRKIESDNTSSIGTSTSTSKSSTVTTSVVNAPIIQNKKVAPLSNSIGKKIVTKNSNINANNQMKKVTNKTVAKKSNVKQICEDSVFQMK